MSLETVAIDKWIYSRLINDSEITDEDEGVDDRIYAIVAPRPSKTPLIIYQQQSARDTRAVNGIRIMIEASYIVKVIVEGASFDPAMPIYERVDELLHRSSGAPDGGYQVLQCVREEPFQMLDVDAGIHFRHLGGRYRVWAQKL